jgi:hypothetical protein
MVSSNRQSRQEREKVRERSDRAWEMLIQLGHNLLSEALISRPPTPARDYQGRSLNVVALYDDFDQHKLLPSGIFVPGGATLYVEVVMEASKDDVAATVANVLRMQYLDRASYVGSLTKESISHPLYGGKTFDIESYSADILEERIYDGLADLAL